MSDQVISELKRADIDLASYREFLRDQRLGVAAARWPLLLAVDQLVVADRWRRSLLAARPPLPSNVTPLPSARPGPTRTADWFQATEILS